MPCLSTNHLRCSILNHAAVPLYFRGQALGIKGNQRVALGYTVADQHVYFGNSAPGSGRNWASLACHKSTLNWLSLDQELYDYCINRDQRRTALRLGRVKPAKRQ